MTHTAVVLLHGALGASDQFEALAALLADSFEVHRLEFEGHGARPAADRPFRMEHFAANVVTYLDEQGLDSAHLFGYSLGGFVACLVGLAQPARAQRIVTLATKFHWDPTVAAREAGFLDVEKMRAKVPHFAQSLAARHTGAGWETVVNQTRAMLLALGESGGFTPTQAAGLTQPVRVMLGDRDRTVTLAETVAIYQALPQGQLEILPDTPHPLEKVSPKRLALALSDFFAA